MCVGWKCSTHCSIKASVVFYWCNQYSLHFWWTCCYSVSFFFFFCNLLIFRIILCNHFYPKYILLLFYLLVFVSTRFLFAAFASYLDFRKNRQNNEKNNFFFLFCKLGKQHFASHEKTTKIVKMDLHFYSTIFFSRFVSTSFYKINKIIFPSIARLSITVFLSLKI